jgi:hypothetical protein
MKFTLFVFSLLFCLLLGACSAEMETATAVPTRVVVNIVASPTIMLTHTAVSPTETTAPTDTLLLTPTTHTLQPAITPTSSPVTPAITETPQLLVTTPDPDAPECPRPEDLPDTGVNISWPPFCIVWIDKFDDEMGYRIRLNYFQSGEHFIYEIMGADIVQFVVPEADAPRLDESLEQCRRRKDIELFVTAIRPGGDWSVDAMALTTHCPLSLPTATQPP